MEDKFAQEIRDKIDHGVSRLSTVEKKLYFSLNYTFLSLGFKNKIKIDMCKLAEILGLKDQTPSDLKPIVRKAFKSIMENTFVEYQFSFNHVQDTDTIELYVSNIDNKEKIRDLLKRAYPNNHIKQ